MKIEDALQLIAEQQPCNHSDLLVSFWVEDTAIRECQICGLEVTRAEIKDHYRLSLEFIQTLNSLKKILFKIKRNKRNTKQLDLF